MSYTPKQRRALVVVFKRALKTLPNTVNAWWNAKGDSPYICHHLEGDGEAHRTARAEVTRRLEGMGTLSAWLANQSDEIDRAVQDEIEHNRWRKLQATRKAWLRSLIKEFSA